MRWAHLLWAELARRPLRTGLTLTAVGAAFALLGLLGSLTEALRTAGQGERAAHRLVTVPQVLGGALPLALDGRLAAMPGVERVTYNHFFFGSWQRADQGVGGFAVPSSWFTVFRGYHMPPQQWRAFETTRSGLLTGASMAHRYGWRIGEQIPIRASTFLQRNGSPVWIFTLCGIYRTRRRDRENTLFLHWSDFEAARAQGRGTVGAYFEQISDPRAAGRIALAIDALSRNSGHPTRTRSFSAEAAHYVAQIFDVSFIVHGVGTAVLLTLLLVIGNGMAYSVRERAGEFGLLKALSFRNRQLVGLVVAEAAVLCAVGGVGGLAVAAAAQEWVLRYFWHHFGVPTGAVGDIVWLEGLALMGVLVGAVSVCPAWQVLRLRSGGVPITR